jgi:hypothetical protein
MSMTDLQGCYDCIEQHAAKMMQQKPARMYQSSECADDFRFPGTDADLSGFISGLPWSKT